MKTDNKKNTEIKPLTSKNKKLSKIGEWLKSGSPVGEIIDMKAVLK